MMIGNVKDEGSLFVRNLKPDATAEMFENWINETFTGVSHLLQLLFCLLKNTEGEMIYLRQTIKHENDQEYCAGVRRIGIFIFFKFF